MLPASQLVPGTFVEVDSTQAQQGAGAFPYRSLIVGQRLSGSPSVADALYRITSADAVAQLAGRGSILHRMALAHFASNRSTEVWIGTLDDNGAGVAATGTITVTGPATASGTIALWLGGNRLTVGVASGDTDADIAAAIDAAILAAADLPVTPSTVGAVTTITFRHKGEVGNDFDIRHSAADGEALPAGVGLTIAAMGSVIAGTANPDLTGLIAALGDEWFQVLGHPYTDSTSLGAIEAEMARRNGPTTQIDGVAVTSAAGTFGTLSALGDSRNSAFSVIVAQAGEDPLTPPMEYSAEVAAIVARDGEAQPNRPFNTAALLNALAIPEADRFSLEERDLLLRDSIATSKIGPGNQVQLERLVTTYQLNASGSPDTSYQDIGTPLTIIRLRAEWRRRMSRYSRHVLADNAKGVAPNVPIMTPELGKGEAIAWFRDMFRLGLVNDLASFKAALRVYRDTVDKTRLVFELPPRLVPGLQIVDTTLIFLF